MQDLLWHLTSAYMKCVYGWAGVLYVITKLYRMDSLPNCLTHGAPLRARESSAINDLPNASNLLKTLRMILAFLILIKILTSSFVSTITNWELSKISEWLKVNKLLLNVAKTNYILFRPRQKPITVSDTITLDNIAVQQVQVTKFLGV